MAAVPPAVGPWLTLTLDTLAVVPVKVNWSVDGLTGLVPPGAVTVTSTVPADSGGEVTVSEVPAPFTTTLVPATVPTPTVSMCTPAFSATAAAGSSRV